MPTTRTELSRGFKSLLGIASLVVIIAGMKASTDILIPFLLSIFIAILCTSPLAWLQKHRIPPTMAVILVVACFILIVTVLSAVVGSSLGSFAEHIPQYQERLQEEMTKLLHWLQKFKIHIPDNIVQEQFNPGVAMDMVSKIMSGLGSTLTNTFLIFLTVVFILFELTTLPEKIRTALGNPNQSFGSIHRFTASVKQYLLIKTWVSLSTGTSIAIWLSIVDIEYPMLWGLLAFMLNFVPNIGAIIAAVPAVLFALIQGGTMTALLTATGYLVINTIIGNIIEPRFLGKELGLSTLVVFLSLVFWGWVLGPVGMILSIPLTMIVKIGLESNKATQWIAVLLSSG